MKKVFTNRVFLNTIILFIFTFSVELLVRFNTGAPFKDFATIRIMGSSLIISLFFAWIGHFLPKLGQRILNIVYVLFIGILCFVEFGLNSYIGFFMGIGNAEQGTKVTEFIKDFASSYKLVHLIILIPLIIFLIYFVIFDKKVWKNKTRNNEMNFIQKAYIEICTVLFIAALCGAYYFTVRSDKFQNELQTESNYALWLYPENSNLMVNNFGVPVYIVCDTISTIRGINADYIMALEAKRNKNKTTKKEEETELIDLKRTIDDTAWKTLNDNTDNSTYKTLNNYFMSRTISTKNEMTGKFENKNLIIILMESVNEIAIMNEEYFPTLYKMYNEGISFRNNYSPRNTCSTGNNEFTVLSSLFTINNLCTANRYANNKYFTGAFNIFNNNGYYTSAYHDYTQKYYKRATILPNLGAQKYMGVTDLGIPYDERYEEWPSDVEFFQKAQSHYMNQDKFMTYLAGVSTHQTYNVPSTLGDKYRKEFEEKGYSKSLSRYLSKMKELDNAMAELLKELEESGKLDDTVIALFGDHFPYGLTDAQINEFMKKNNGSYTVNRNSVKNKDVDRTPLVIYNSQIEPIKVEDYTSIIDLLPTLLNMFGFDYDPRMYMGTDIFSPEHVSRAVFADGSWANERGYYHLPNSKMNYNEGADQYSVSEIQDINKEISTRQKMSASAIKSNYYKYLKNGLEKYKVPEEVTEENETIEEVSET